MAQGKLKVKSKVPNQKQKAKEKGKAFTRRSSEFFSITCLFLAFKWHLAMSKAHGLIPKLISFN